MPQAESNNAQYKNELKIIGTADNGELALDCTITWDTWFNKRSQKFVQWTDITGMVYGLGFNSETDLNEFMDTFLELKQKISNAQNNVHPLPSGRQQPEWSRGLHHSQQPQQQQQHQQTTSPGDRNDRAPDYNAAMARGSVSSATSQYPANLLSEQATTNGTSNITANDNPRLPSRSQSSTGPLIGKLDNSVVDANDSARSVGRATPSDVEDSHSVHSEHQIKEQLRYENERLKQALEESSKNASLWQNELLNLRTNNVKLTQALQESKAHVEEWEKELLSLRDWNKELQMRLASLESKGENGNPDAERDAELNKYKNYANEVEKELKRKDNELEKLQKAMEQMEIKGSVARQNGDSNSDIMRNDSELKQKLDVLVAKLESKTHELVSVQKELAQCVHMMAENS